MNFPKKLSQLRKEQGFTQQSLSDSVGIHLNQIKRYEAGTSQPTLEALVKLVKTLHVSLDTLVFGEGDREPEERLKLQFEAISQFDDEDKLITQGVLEGLILKDQAKKSMQRQEASRK